MDGGIISLYSSSLLVCGLFVAGYIKFKAIKGVEDSSLTLLFDLSRSQYKDCIRQGIILEKLKEAFDNNTKLNYEEYNVAEVCKEYGEWWITLDGEKEYLIKDDGEKIEIFKFHSDLLNYRQWDAYAWWGFFSLTLTGLLIPVVEYILPFLPINFPKLISLSLKVNFNELIFGFSFILFFTYGIFKMISNIDENGVITLDHIWQFFGFGLWWVLSNVIYLILASESNREGFNIGGDPSIFVYGTFFGLLPFYAFYLFEAPSGLLLSGLIAVLPQSFGISLIRLHTPDFSFKR